MIAWRMRVDVLAGRKVHHRVGAEVDRRVQLLQLFVDVAGDGRVADVGVDLALGGDADAHRLQPAGRCTLLAGITIRPAATSSRISSGERSSRWATNSISGVIWPARAASSCVVMKASVENRTIRPSQPEIGGPHVLLALRAAEESRSLWCGRLGCTCRLACTAMSASNLAASGSECCVS